MRYGSPPPKKPDSLYEKPKRLRDCPRYVAQVVGGFFSRFFYVVRLLLETSPGLFVLMALCSIAAGVLPVGVAYAGKYVINAVSDALAGEGVTPGEGILTTFRGTLSAVALFLALQFLFTLLSRLISRCEAAVRSLAGERISAHIRLKIMQKAKTVDLGSFDDPAFYEKLENANREAGMRPLQILSATFSTISAFISAVSFFVILCTIGWEVPLILLLFILPSAIVNHVFRTRGFWYMRRASKERRQMNYYARIVTDKDLAKEMRLSDLPDTFIDKFDAAFHTYYRGIRRLTLREMFWQMIAAVVRLVGETAIFFYIAYRVVGGEMQIGDYSLLSGALVSVGGQVSTMLNATATIYEGTLFIDNLMTFLREKPTVVSTLSTPRVPQHHVPHTVRFENVSFRYPGAERDVIHDFSCEFRTGDRVVLVGVNGAGKTTLIKLLTRLYDPTAGRITLDGYDLREYDPKALYPIFGTVFQDFGKYAATAGENIALGNVHRPSDPEAIRRAAALGDAAPFIEKLDGGYETPLMRFFEDDATELSQGQWQKLSIARAFYADADIFILDEPTAALDAIAEQEIYDRFAELSKHKLTVLVSHRLSSAVTATKILVISDGMLAESGTHEELMAASGIYHHLFSTQAKHYILAGTKGEP